MIDKSIRKSGYKFTESENGKNYEFRKNYIRILNTGLFEGDKDFRFWTAYENFPVYKSTSSSYPFTTVKKNEKFIGLKAEYRFYDKIKVKITGTPKGSFDHEWCPEGNPFKRGDYIEILNGLGGHGYRYVLHNNQIKTAQFGIDRETQKIEESVYDGCPRITGDIVKNTEYFELWIEIITKNNEVGWLKVSQSTEDPYLFSRINPGMY